MIGALYRWWHGFDAIPQSEIDAEVRRILVEYPGDPAGYASGVVERLQWSKDRRQVVKAEKVLKAIRRAL